MPHSAEASSVYSIDQHSMASDVATPSTVRAQPGALRSSVLAPERVYEHNPVSPLIDRASSNEPTHITSAYNDPIRKRDRNRDTVSSLTHTALDDIQDMDEVSPMVTPMLDERRKRREYFDQQFQYKGNMVDSVRERIERDSPVIAELRTNVIIKDEFTLVTDMSYHLSTRYARPQSCIMIEVQHSTCLLMAGSFEPAYILTISALPSQLQPTTNKRNAALIQSFMTEIISVPPERGILRFQAIPEENLATNGVTIFGDIDRAERQQAEQHGGAVKRAFTNTRKSMTFRKDAPQTEPEALPKVPQSPQNGEPFLLPTSPIMPVGSPAPEPGVFELPATEARDQEKPKAPKAANGIPDGQRKLPNGKSNVTTGGGNEGKQNQSHRRTPSSGAPIPIPIPKSTEPAPKPTASKHRANKSVSDVPKPPPPPVPEEKTPKVNKRKSFLSVFKR